jgi:uncharacterized protein (DUF302 family)
MAKPTDTKGQPVSYHFSVTVHDDFDRVVERTKSALAAEGFGIVSEIDMAATLRAKVGHEMGAYLILGACNPPFALKALMSDPGIGTLLPCNVVVRANGDGVVVDFMDPEAVLDLVKAPGVREVADDVRTRMEQVRDSIACG